MGNNINCIHEYRALNAIYNEFTIGNFDIDSEKVCSTVILC